MEPTPGDSQPLTLQELLNLRKIQNGLDVRDYGLAKRLRAIEARMPHLLDLGDPMGTYGPRDVVPYFGAITTKAGDAAIAEGLDGVPAATQEPKGVRCGA